MSRSVVFVVFPFVLLATSTVQAGMPSAIGLSRYAVERMVPLSTAVFLGLVVSTLVIRVCWGILVHETDWPKPTILKSFAASLLGGMLFFLVLVMIAGSRELFSPGAWVPDGVLYRLANPPQSGLASSSSLPVGEMETARREAIEKLRDSLQKQAQSESGLPNAKTLFHPPKYSDRRALEIWTVPFASGIQYEYRPDEKDGPWLVVEPVVLEQQTPKLKRLAIDRKSFEIVEVPSTKSMEAAK